MATKKNSDKKKIIFVCTGNTCRSPMAEFLLKNYLKKNKLSNITVSSAGLSAEGEMTAEARAALAYLDVPYSKRKAKQLNSLMVEKNDLVVCMTASHKRAITAHMGELPKIVTVGELTGGKDVGDPFGMDIEAYINVAKYLDYANKDIVAALKKICEEKENSEGKE